MIVWHHKDKLFSSWVMFCIGTPDEFRTILAEGGYTELDDIHPERAAGMHIGIDLSNNTNGNDCQILWLKEWRENVFVHEAVHLSLSILERANVPINIDNTEVVAYYIEYWTRELRRLRKKYPGGRNARDAFKDTRA